MPDGDAFYLSIEPVDDFESLARRDHYRALPHGWSIVVADVARSTEAITEGRYKAVNTVGVAVIASIRNVVRPVEVPYVFGGDGATLCVPDRFVGQVRSALASTVAMAEGGFGLELRAAVVPVSYVRDAELDVLVARHRVSEHYVQCALFGGGAELIEQNLKIGGLPAEYHVDPDPEASADYTGLECRWREVPSPATETVSVIIEANGRPDERLTMYQWVMDRTRQIYGEAADCRPIAEEGLRVALGTRALSHETRLHEWRASKLAQYGATFLLKLWVALGTIFLRFGIETDATDWGVYKRDLVANTDFRKFDGSVRFVLAGEPGQREELTVFLERLRDSGALRFGMHASTSALMTCLIDKRQGDHFHFVDGSGGGYASAAAQMKRG